MPDEGHHKHLTAEIRREAWFRGDLWYLLREDAQTRAYRQIIQWKEQHPEDVGPFVLNTHRGLGKSFLGLSMGIGRCLKYPNQQVRVGAPDQKQCKSYARPIIRQLLAMCPPELQPHKVGDTWFFRNPRWKDKHAVSEFHLFGCKEDAESQRGPRSDFIFLDEVRDIENLVYVATDVLGFHFVGRNNCFMLICSTPPDDARHAFVSKFIPEAQDDHRYLCIPTTENADWRPQDDRALAKMCGGKNTIAWQREAGCVTVSNPDRLIVPEMPEAKKTIVVESYQRPEYFFPYMYIDTGWVDYTALIWAYVDWHKQWLIVEKTLLVRKKHTGHVANLIRSTEKELYGENGPYHPVTRLGDLTPQQLDDLEIEHGVTILPAKDRNDPDANISSLRFRIGEERIRIIREPNASLISQLENGNRDPKTGKIPRDPEHGHWDAGMALSYGCHDTDFFANPFPKNVMRLSGSQFMSPGSPPEDGRIKITRNPIVITRHRIR